ncbi:hypothetical protein ACIGXM_21315 [Kitasatospora sp. NPDC052896]|uniref:hypothetical protein n=1 Tax=Kitasatospora sp. NPDC052896 TaxID=3364061 RepID=UPI0037C501FE
MDTAVVARAVAQEVAASSGVVTVVNKSGFRPVEPGPVPRLHDVVRRAPYGNELVLVDADQVEAQRLGLDPVRGCG